MQYNPAAPYEFVTHCNNALAQVAGLLSQVNDRYSDLDRVLSRVRAAQRENEKILDDFKRVRDDMRDEIRSFSKRMENIQYGNSSRGYGRSMSVAPRRLTTPPRERERDRDRERAYTRPPPSRASTVGPRDRSSAYPASRATSVAPSMKDKEQDGRDQETERTQPSKKLHSEAKTAQQATAGSSKPPTKPTVASTIVMPPPKQEAQAPTSNTLLQEVLAEDENVEIDEI